MQKKTQAWRQARIPFKPSLQLPELRTHGQRIAKIVDGMTTMLGHSALSTTQIYTQVSIEKLRQIHAATHPAKVEKVQSVEAEIDREG